MFLRVSVENTMLHTKKFFCLLFCRHLRIAQELFDKVGEGRACWSLGNAHSSMGQYLEAYQYARRHLEISRDTKDRMGQATAQLNLADLCRTLGYTPPDSEELPHERKENSTPSSDLEQAKKSRRVSMEQMDLIKMTPDAKKAAQLQAAASNKNRDQNNAGEDKENNGNLNKSGLLDEEDFFDFISRFQSKRMDDQRCSLTLPSSKGNYDSEKKYNIIMVQYIDFFFFKQHSEKLSF